MAKKAIDSNTGKEKQLLQKPIGSTGNIVCRSWQMPGGQKSASFRSAIYILFVHKANNCLANFLFQFIRYNI